jgi:hypothetical protein
MKLTLTTPVVAPPSVVDNQTDRVNKRLIRASLPASDADTGVRREPGLRSKIRRHPLPLALLMGGFENWLCLLAVLQLPAILSKMKSKGQLHGQKRKAKKTKIKRKRTAKKNKEWSTPKVNKWLPLKAMFS